jgi:iron complex outermembrane receptor protein
MYRYHALGGASLAVLGSALSSCRPRGAQTSLPAVTVEAPRGTQPDLRPEAGRSFVRPDAARPPQQPAPSARDRGHYPSVARALLYQAPTGQTRRPSTAASSRTGRRSSADVLREAGISVKQGNGPRDIGISIRGPTRNGLRSAIS